MLNETFSVIFQHCGFVTFYRIRHQVWYNGQWYTLCIDRNAFLIYRCRQNKKIGRHLGTFEKKSPTIQKDSKNGQFEIRNVETNFPWLI